MKLINSTPRANAHRYTLCKQLCPQVPQIVLYFSLGVLEDDEMVQVFSDRLKLLKDASVRLLRLQLLRTLLMERFRLRLG